MRRIKLAVIPVAVAAFELLGPAAAFRSEEHTSELQSPS